MNESGDKPSLGTQILGCAIMYVLVAMVLAWLIGQPWMPRPARIVIAVLLLLGLLLFALVVIVNVVGRWLGLAGPAAERGEPPMRFYRLLLRFYLPYMNLKRRFSKPEVDTRPSVESMIQTAVDEGTTELDLSSHLLETLPPGLSELTSLTDLSLYENVLASVDGIGQLTNLESLILSDNSLEALPAEFANLKKLTELYISKNALADFPPEILALTELRELEIDGNVLRVIPPEISGLKKLDMLNVASNELDEIPPEIGELTNLTFLAVDYNHLKSLPVEIGNLSRLESLYLYGNELTTLPPEIGRLTNLKILNVYSNPLASIPPEVLALPDVEIIVDKKQVEAIPELRDRPNVKIVDL